MRKSFAILISLLFTIVGADCLASDFWVDYGLAEYVRSAPNEPWQLTYSAPFGCRISYGVGYIATDRTITDPTEPNCFQFDFTPTAADGLNLLHQKIEVTKYHGDKFCDKDEGANVTEVTSVEMTVEQNNITTFYFPFISGKETKVELKANWKPVNAPLTER